MMLPGSEVSHTALIYDGHALVEGIENLRGFHLFPQEVTSNSSPSFRMLVLMKELDGKVQKLTFSHPVRSFHLFLASANLKVYPSRWSCSHYGFAADYLQCRPCHPRENCPINTGLIILELTFLLVTFVLLWRFSTPSPSRRAVQLVFRRTHDTRLDCTCQRGLLVSSRGFRRVSPVQGSPGTKIRAELSSNGSDVRPAGSTPHKKSTPRSDGMGIVFCITNGARRLPPRCPVQSPYSTAPLFRFSAPFAFLREVCYGTFHMDVLQLRCGRIGVTTSFAAYLVLLNVWRLEVRTAVGLLLRWTL